MARPAADDGFISDLVKRGVSSAVATSFVANNSLDPAIQTAMNAADHAATVALANDLPTGLDPAVRTAIIARAGTTSTTGGDGGGDGGDGGGGDKNPDPVQPPIDWRSYLTDWGFTGDIVNELDRIFRVYTDPTQAGAAALAYIRGTDWYVKTFPGIQSAIAKGLFSDEQGYRSYVNQANQFYQRYFGRDATTNEIAAGMNAGHTTGQLDEHLAGQAYINANRGDIQYTLGAFDSKGKASEEELGAYGDHLNNLDNMIGPQLQSRLDKARAKFSRIFEGQSASPAMSTLSNGRLFGSSLGAGNNPDVGA